MFLIHLFFLMTSLAHEYHVGFYTLDFKENSCQITMKLFSDDFEKAFYKNGKEIKIGDDLSENQLSKSLQNYLSSHFKLNVNDKIQELAYVGAEWDEDYHAIYFYWEAKVEDTKELNIEIENSIFLEVSNQQQNMHHIKLSNREYTLLLDYEKRKSKIQLN